jgi:hypothetical protein
MTQFARMDRKSVFVRNYLRFRYGQWEHVCSHYRTWPN